MEIQPAHFYTAKDLWYPNQKFARDDKTSFGWLAIKKTSVAYSDNKNWNEQNKLLSALEAVPNAAEMCWFITTYLEVRGIRLFEGAFVRTSSLDVSNNYVSAGSFIAQKLNVISFWGDGRDVGLGMSAGRKFLTLTN